MNGAVCCQAPDRRDSPPGTVRLYIPAAILFVVSLAATIELCRSMAGGMVMPGGWTMSMMWMRMPGQGWPAAIAMFLLMWLAMMVAMMLPSAAPMFLRFRPGATAALVAWGYFAVWLLAGLVVYALGAAWALAAMRSAVLSRAAPALGGALLVFAGTLQFSRWKTLGLARCREPLRRGSRASGCTGPEALGEGLRQGLSCVVCCSGPMLALLSLGVMNIVAMLAVAVVIASEKLLPNPRPVVVASGWLGVLAGTGIVFGALL
jgi:predicted metal-binding membrane protein